MIMNNRSSTNARLALLVVLCIVVSACGNAPQASQEASSSPARAPSSAAFSPSATPGVASSAAVIHGVITVDPPEVAIDEPTSIRLSGFPPNQEVTVRATTVGLVYPDLTTSSVVRESTATFRTDAYGDVDLAKQAPISGDYAIVDPMGLFWSMKDLPSPKVPTVPALPSSPNAGAFVQYRFQITADVDGIPVATTTFDQDLGSPEVTETEIAEGGMLGQFYLPPGAGPFPAVIVLSGSNGNLTIRRPKLIAAHGYAVLSLAYFNYTSLLDGSSLPSSMDEIPLEYFGKAIRWLQARPHVDRERIGIYGTSVGGMVALHVAARYPQIKAVIATSPPTVTWGGDANRASLTFQDKPLPFADPFLLEVLARPFTDAVAGGRDYASAMAGILSSIKADKEIAAAIIPVERIKGSVLIVSGTNDIQLPSVVYGELVIDRLEAHHFAFPYRHIVNVGAGHIIDVPYVDRSIEIREGGGTPEAMEKAGEAMWRVVLDYLAAMK
jgi:pimeloyl-ACP methyl ester carboxylesterase